jgi:hypothetical protein
VTRLNVQPLLAAIPTPPAPKGQWGYRQWYVARKRGYLSMTDAARLCETASLRIEEVYPELQVEEVGYINGELHRDCAKCGTSFIAKTAGKRGGLRTRCRVCPTPVKQCGYCNKVFQNARRVYCSTYCANKVQHERVRSKANAKKKQRVLIACEQCAQVFDKKSTSAARFCSKCAQRRQIARSKYISPYPMCAGCGKDKEPGRATCGHTTCVELHRKAKRNKGTYKLLPETVLVLRACPRCDACKKPFVNERSCIDHCHTTGKIRGVLCNPCNTALGFAKESPHRLRSLADYIEQTL